MKFDCADWSLPDWRQDILPDKFFLKKSIIEPIVNLRNSLTKLRHAVTLSQTVINTDFNNLGSGDFFFSFLNRKSDVIRQDMNDD